MLGVHPEQSQPANLSIATTSRRITRKGIYGAQHPRYSGRMLSHVLSTLTCGGNRELDDLCFWSGGCLAGGPLTGHTTGPSLSATHPGRTSATTTCQNASGFATRRRLALVNLRPIFRSPVVSPLASGNIPNQKNEIRVIPGISGQPSLRSGGGLGFLELSAKKAKGGAPPLRKRGLSDTRVQTNTSFRSAFC